MNFKLLFSSGIIFLTVLLTFFFADKPILLSTLIIVVAYLKHLLYPIKKELVWFALVSLGGGITEVFLVNSGSVWVYSISQFMGIPIWIPLFWGTMATAIIVVYNELIRK